MRNFGMMMTGFTVFSLGTVAVFAGCLNIDDLQGRWKLVEVQSQPVQPGGGHELPAFTIKDLSIEGFDGCNRFGGRLDQPGSMVSTQIGCPDGTLKLPLDLTDPMSHLKEAKIDKGRLSLPERGEMPASVFQRED